LNFVKAADVLVQLRRKLSAETGVLGSLAKRIVPLDAWLNDVRSKVDESGFVKMMPAVSFPISDVTRKGFPMKFKISCKGKWTATNDSSPTGWW